MSFEFSRKHTTFIDSGTNLRHGQEQDGTIVQTTHEQDDSCACNFPHCPVLVVLFLCPVLVRSVIVYAEFSLHSCFRCNTQISKIANFKCDFLSNDNDSEVAVKTKNAPFFMNFPNI
jgi:hypothetical protein